MITIIADDIDELYIVENWIECGIQNTPVLNEVTYPNKTVEVNYDINTNKPHVLLKDNTWNQIAGVAYINENDADVELVKPFREMEGITIEEGKVILPPEEPMEDTTNDSGTV